MAVGGRGRLYRKEKEKETIPQPTDNTTLPDRAHATCLPALTRKTSAAPRLVP